MSSQLIVGVEDIPPYEGEGHRRNLKGAILIDAHLEGADLRDADFEGAHLEGADLTGADLTGAFLKGAFLKGAHLEGVILTGLNLRDAHFEGADLRDAHLEGADLRDADFEGAHLEGAHLEGAKLMDAHFEGAHFEGAHLEGAELMDAHLEGAHLEGAHLERANLTGAHLERANLEGAHLERAILERTDLRRADLTRAHLRGVDLTFTDLEGAILDDGVLLNNGNEPVAMEIHRNAHKLLSNKKFLQIIKFDKITPTEFNYKGQKKMMLDFINKNKELFFIAKLEMLDAAAEEEYERNLDEYTEELKGKIEIIWSKMCGGGTLDPTTEEAMYKSTKFAYSQKDPRFPVAYISIFIDETVKAYDDDGDGVGDTLSCVGGIRERFYTSLLGAASIVLTMDNFEKTPEIISLDCISKLGNIQKDPNKVIQLWSGEMTKYPEKWVGNRNHKIKNFKDFMRDDYKKDDCYEINKETIEEMINTKALEIDYVFNNDKELVFGGKKTKNKSKRKSTNKKKSRKSTNKKKSRKSRKSRKSKK